MDTESRHLARDDATERVRGTVARRPGATSWFKKIDSTLRGHVGAEIVALLEAGRLRTAGHVRLAPEGGDGMRRPILGVTMGDPAGVGPEIIVRAAAEPEVRGTSRPVVIGSASTLGEALALVGSPLRLHGVTRVAECRWRPGTLEVLDLANVDMATLPRARVSAAAGRAAYEYIETAVDLAKDGTIDGIVTAPINKEALAAAGMPHSGHTTTRRRSAGWASRASTSPWGFRSCACPWTTAPRSTGRGRASRTTRAWSRLCRSPSAC